MHTDSHAPWVLGDRTYNFIIDKEKGHVTPQKLKGGEPNSRDMGQKKRGVKGGIYSYAFWGLKGPKCKKKALKSYI